MQTRIFTETTSNTLLKDQTIILEQVLLSKSFNQEIKDRAETLFCSENIAFLNEIYQLYFQFTCGIIDKSTAQFNLKMIANNYIVANTEQKETDTVKLNLPASIHNTFPKNLDELTFEAFNKAIKEIADLLLNISNLKKNNEKAENAAGTFSSKYEELNKELPLINIQTTGLEFLQMLDTHLASLKKITREPKALSSLVKQDNKKARSSVTQSIFSIFACFFKQEDSFIHKTDKLIQSIDNAKKELGLILAYSLKHNISAKDLKHKITNHKAFKKLPKLYSQLIKASTKESIPGIDKFIAANDELNKAIANLQGAKTKPETTPAAIKSNPQESAQQPKSTRSVR